MVNKNKSQVISSYFDEEPNVKTPNRSLSTSNDGRTLYSYNTPIAYQDESGEHYLNKDKYSVTTSSQQNLFRREAKDRGVDFEEVSESEIREKRYS